MILSLVVKRLMVVEQFSFPAPVALREVLHVCRHELRHRHDDAHVIVLVDDRADDIRAGCEEDVVVVRRIAVEIDLGPLHAERNDLADLL